MRRVLVANREVVGAWIIVVLLTPVSIVLGSAVVDSARVTLLSLVLLGLGAVVIRFLSPGDPGASKRGWRLGVIIVMVLWSPLGIFEAIRTLHDGDSPSGAAATVILAQGAGSLLSIALLRGAWPLIWRRLPAPTVAEEIAHLQ
jgi:hypothetical protein